MTSIGALKTYIDKASIDSVIIDERVSKLMHYYGCSITPYHDVWLAEVNNKFRSKPMTLAKELKKLGWHSVFATEKHFILSRNAKLAAERAKAFQKAAFEEDTAIRKSMVYASAENIRVYVEMANLKLTATTLEGQLEELNKLGYTVTKKSGGGYSIVAQEKRKAVTPGDIVSVRARLEAYVGQMFPGNVFTHFVVKSGMKSLIYSIGVGDNIQEAVSNS